jgi:hypothetical protein
MLEIGYKRGTKLRDRIEHLLTETKVVLPAHKRCLGFNS